MLDTKTPLIRDPRSLLLEMAQRMQVCDALRLIVDRIASSPAVALARIWLIRPAAGCATCPRASECPDRTNCLHLVASAGSSLVDPTADLTRLDGEFRRFPIGVRKVGRIASTGQPMEVSNIEGNPDWLVKPEWAKAEGIRGFGGQPLIHHGNVLGVLAVFSRTTCSEEDLQWLRTIANHAAASLANASAWEEIEKLRHRLELENDYLQEEVNTNHSFGDMVGSSAALQKVTQQIELVAPTDSTVLVTGESGTGKELVAREIHRRSSRSDRPLIKVNCAAIPRELYDSEFFGHTKGSFTGAVRDRVGRFELADGGTLFLDEIGEIPLELQSKLLRVLQEGELERVGEEQTREVDVRIIAATNRDLKAESEAKRFRADLYYRLSVFPIELPSLSKRKEDIPLLAEHLLHQLARKLGRETPRLTKANIQQLKQYEWPGNIRELQHVLERAMITARGGRLRFQLDQATSPNDTSSLERQSSLPSLDGDKILTTDELKAFEAANIRRALAASGGKVSGPGGAAELLNTKPTTLASRIKSLGTRLS
ncbi:transcriptional regulator, NifA subfamily, Fis Family [Rhodopirellula maiorica SM1]|uniref:Transcriptional regulator, NifA subfamily, Fis Family n=1 Tax=Rhodopirellula maiorica SM1 TaxID=1265738 RepID=M5RPG9_9BACT|nr:sigma 54-interacting transcriptional regulator [Rhodopirellula maiorica]EMI15844.1 transcriptional regulator, NifA subfamily, Fis Family [Rhodopirellula maiorica SM1]